MWAQRELFATRTRCSLSLRWQSLIVYSRPKRLVFVPYDVAGEVTPWPGRPLQEKLFPGVAEGLNKSTNQRHRVAG